MPPSDGVQPSAPGALDGIRVVDLTRVLAGPFCTQLLADYGAEVIKIERPGIGDDTRRWGPPYLQGVDGEDTTESTFYLSANRNKRSVTIDISRPEGRDLIVRLLEDADVLIENYRVGALGRYRLGYDDLKGEFPKLVYCSITGFGQTGPYAARPGYDLMAQGLGGIMSVTGEPDGQPMKVGIGIADIMTGMYATSAILAAIHHRTVTGKGQCIDMALLDSQVAWLSSSGQNYLTSREPVSRFGNAHPNIVPYQVFPSADGHVVIAAGNDTQFQRLCAFAGLPELVDDERFATNEARVRNRDALIAIIEAAVARHPSAYWLEGLEGVKVPTCPINSVADVFADPQVRHRGMEIALPHPSTKTPVDLIASPIKMSETAPEYTRAPPTLGQHTAEVLGEILGLGADEVAALKSNGVV